MIDKSTPEGRSLDAITQLNKECVVALREFDLKNDEARHAHKTYKDKCKELHELIAGSSLPMPLFDEEGNATEGDNGHSEASPATGQASQGATPAPDDPAWLETPLSAIVEAESLPQLIADRLHTAGLKTVQDLDAFTRRNTGNPLADLSPGADPLCNLKDVTKALAKKLRKAVDDYHLAELARNTFQDAGEETRVTNDVSEMSAAALEAGAVEEVVPAKRGRRKTPQPQPE